MNKNASKEQYLQQKLEELKTICQEKGMRLTQQRIEIYKEVASSCEHPDAETVTKRLNINCLQYLLIQYTEHLLLWKN